MTGVPKGLCKAGGQRHVAKAPAFRIRHMALPLRSRNAELPFGEINSLHSSAIISPHRKPAFPPDNVIRCATALVSRATFTSRSSASNSCKRGFRHRGRSPRALPLKCRTYDCLLESQRPFIHMRKLLPERLLTLLDDASEVKSFER